MVKKQVAIVNYNTPELTEAAILSLRKHGGETYEVTVFDNSDARPFTKQMAGVTIIDNTQGQVINFDEELAKFPNKCQTVGTYANYYGSDKHMMTIQKLWDILPDGFLLMDSDILLKDSVDFMFQEDRLCVGHIQDGTNNNRFNIDRLVPFLCYINVKMCREWGIKYFDPERNRGLVSEDPNNPNNWYDTGATFLDEVRKCEAKGRRIDIRPLMKHLQAGSWENKSLQDHARWLMDNAALWCPDSWERPQTDKVALCAIGRLENRYAKEFVEHHLKLGFDHIIIYDNNHDGEETFDKVLKTFITKGQVEIVDWRNLEHRQSQAYTHCYDHNGNKYAWIAFFDFDEHLTLETDKNVKDLLADFADADVVKLNWLCYGDNGHVKADRKKLATRFTTPLADNLKVKATEPENYHVKSFVRGGLPWAIWQNPHCPMIVGRYAFIDGSESKCFPFHTPSHSRAYLKHYVTKTIEEWMTNKVQRGEGSSSKNTELLRQNAVEIFFMYNERTLEKEKWLKDNGFTGKP